MREIEELRAIAISMGKPLEKLLYEMLSDAMNDNDRLNNIINNNKILQERLDNAIEKLESLIIFWKKYSPVDNYMQVEQFKAVIDILNGDSDDKKENI